MKKILIGAVLTVVGASSQQAWADRCDYDVGSGPVNMTIPLSVSNISVGADVPLGTTVHTLRVIGSSNKRPWVICKTENGTQKFSVDQYLRLDGSVNLVAGWTGSYAGAVYQTGISGLGFAIVNNDGFTSGSAITTTAVKKWTTDIGPVPYHFFYGNSFTILFIKTGPIAGGTLNGANLPAVVLTTGSATPVTNIPDTPYRINFSGNLNVIAASCKTPDVNVNMGKFEIDSWFGAGKANATPWVPVNLMLTECPAFYGNYSDPSSPPTFNTGDGFTQGKLVSNSAQVRFYPTYGTSGADQGIINLDSSSNAATGVGIQIAQGQTSPVPVNINNTIVAPLSSQTATSFTLPFAARYIKTGTTVTPGTANSKMLVLINYY